MLVKFKSENPADLSPQKDQNVKQTGWQESEICLTARGGPQSGRRVVAAETPLSLLLRANPAQSTPLMPKKAECFGEFFASKCSLGAADFPDNLPKENFPHVKPRTMDKLSTVHFRRVNVRKELRRLNTAKASGPDDIPAHILKSCADELSHPLTKLFSLCFRKQIQPYQWKCARAVPVYKKKSKSLPQKYHPVHLSIISKMESIVNRQLLNFLESRGVLSPRQFGFRKGLSATDLLMKLYHEWAAAAASGGSAHVLAIDIAGAFDKVSHTGLLHKASVYGLDGALHEWLSSYLTGRSIHAVVGGQSSSSSKITSGVPQGSILGPTLFIL